MLELRKWIIDEIGSEEITAEPLHEFEQDIRGLYLDILKGMFTPPTLANTDGDRFVPQRLYFEIESADNAFQRLKGLAEGESESDLLKDATIKDGLLVKAEIPWLGGGDEARKQLGGPVLLGLLNIEETRLVVEVNSIQRADLFRRLIEERLGNGAKYKTTLIEPIESQVRETWQAATASGPGSSSSAGLRNSEGSGFISLDDAQPELPAMMEESAKHWDSWFDLPVPALNDMTPREASKTEEGRELLESLLLLYENYTDDSANNVFKPDPSALRRELRME